MPIFFIFFFFRFAFLHTPFRRTTKHTRQRACSIKPTQRVFKRAVNTLLISHKLRGERMRARARIDVRAKWEEGEGKKENKVNISWFDALRAFTYTINSVRSRTYNLPQPLSSPAASSTPSFHASPFFLPVHSSLVRTGSIVYAFFSYVLATRDVVSLLSSSRYRRSGSPPSLFFFFFFSGENKRVLFPRRSHAAPAERSISPGGVIRPFGKRGCL